MTSATRTYLDLGAVRIQSYLARSRHLWGRRGASFLLAEHSHADWISELSSELEPGTTLQPNDEAASVDGVISLIVDPPERAADVAHCLARALTRRLPGLQLEARAAAGASYVAAYQQMKEGEALLEWLPAPFEFPTTRRCDECGENAVIGVRTPAGGQEVRLCADCTSRHDGISRMSSALKRADASSGTFAVEYELLEHFGATATDDFGELASLGPGDRRNHLATIAADGNALGRLFAAARDRLAEGADDPEALKELSKSVKQTMREALIQATAAVYDSDRDEHLPVVPHVLGGDDVLVSVSAPVAWPFVRALLTAFRDSEPARHLAQIAQRVDLPAPTLSAGVVLSHASLPFGQQVELAERLLRAAKTHVCGEGYSAGWLDVTWDGPRPVPGRRAMTLQELLDGAAGLDALARVPASARQALARELDTPDPGYAQRRVTSRLARQEPDVSRDVRTYLDSRARHLLEPHLPGKPEEMVRVLRDGLSLSRWWR